LNGFKGGGFGTTLVLAVLFVGFAVAAAIGLARYGERVPWLAPLLGEPTRTTGTVVVQDIQRLNELATVKWTQQVIVEEEGNEEIWRSYLPEFVSGEKVLLIAVGDVQAGVNLDELGEDDVRVEEDGVTIDLPEARILSASLDEDETKLYSRERGLIDFRGDDALIEEARRDALDEIQSTAQQNGIIEQAQTNAEGSIRGFLVTLGHEEVVFR
jgi:hypothetical protein